LHQLHDALQGQQVYEYGNIQQAFEDVLKQSNNNQLILVCGSFHTLEAVWEYLEQCQ
jgi:dihydrofolate synthase/folylpolyglutamate synthase